MAHDPARVMPATHARATTTASALDGYPPIGDYAVIGDCQSLALISRQGSIDWYCPSAFSGPSLFAAILDRRAGGRFVVCPVGLRAVQRRYVGETNVLETTFHAEGGVLRLTDAMTIPPDDRHDCLHPIRELLRRIEVLEGTVTVEVLYLPRPDYARSLPRLDDHGPLGWQIARGDELHVLRSDLPLAPIPSGDGLHGRCVLAAGEVRFLSLTYDHGSIGTLVALGAEAEARLRWSLDWWHAWSRRCCYHGRYRDAVVRSVLTLKLLTYALSGAVVAAGTTSLPEAIGGVRNWDYRYCWLRDAALTLDAFTDLGYGAEGAAFFEWLLHATRLTRPRLQVVYNVFGEARLPEYRLDHLEGYRGSRPVRVGNAAWQQHQLDVYGEVILAAASFVQHQGHLDPEEAALLHGFGHIICDMWRKPDHGIWEVPGSERHYTYSKMMCWAALNCLVRLAQDGHLSIPVERFRHVQTEIEQDIETRAFSAERNTYTAVFGGDRVEASLLLLGRYGYRPPDHPRMVATFQAIERELTRGALVYRYAPDFDPLPGDEGAFGICSFWAVDYLARLGRIEAATGRFEQLLGYANDVGLYGEQIDPATGAALGNFPQAFSHVGLIVAAQSLAGPGERGTGRVERHDHEAVAAK